MKNKNTNQITIQTLILWVFNLAFIITPIYFRFVNEELFEFNKIILVYSFTTIIASLWLVRMVLEKRLIFKRTPLDIPIALFLLSQIVSTIFSIHTRTSLLGYYSRFNGGLLSTFSYITLYYAFVSNIKKRDLGSVLISIFTSAMIVSVYGILEHFGHSISCLFAGTKEFGVNCWKQDVQTRVFATFGQPNWLAAYAITLIPLGIILSVQKKYNLTKKAFYTSATILLVLVLIFTKSRSGMLALSLSLILFSVGIIIIRLRDKSKFTKIIDKKTSATLLGAFILSIIIFGTAFTPDISISLHKQKPINIEKPHDITVNRLDIGGTDSGEIRKIVWQGGIDIWKRYPIIGSGVETFAYSYYLDRPREHNDVSEWDFLYNKAHNELINLMATTGTIGLLTYLSVFIVFGWLVIKIVFSKQKSNNKLFSIAIAAGIFAQFISNFFGFSTVVTNLLLFTLLGFFIVLIQDEKEQAIEEKLLERTSLVPESGEQYLGITLVLIFGLFFLFRIYNYWSADHNYAQGKNYFNSGNYQIGIQKLLIAIEKSPNEALFYDTLSDDYAKLSIELAKQGQATAASQLVQEAIVTSNHTLELNNRHLNFYRTRSRMFITLAQLNEDFIAEANNTILVAVELAPNDPKLIYTLGVIEQTLDNDKEAQLLLEKAVSLKPNYERARWKLAELYEKDGDIEKARDQLLYILKHISLESETALEKLEALEML